MNGFEGPSEFHHDLGRRLASLPDGGWRGLKNAAGIKGDLQQISRIFLAHSKTFPKVVNPMISERLCRIDRLFDSTSSANILSSWRRCAEGRLYEHNPCPYATANLQRPIAANGKYI